jgi:hypothetical protein
MTRPARNGEHRKPPLHPYRQGFCVWCDQPITPRLKKNGQPYAIQASWHKECAGEYRACCAASRFFDDLAERDGLKCACCGEAPHGWVQKFPSTTCWKWDEEARNSYQYTPIEWRPLLDVDHRIPLWKVRDLPNLQLLCRGDAGGRCHQIKSAKEAAERAHLDNLAGETKKGRGEKAKKAIPSRGFAKAPAGFKHFSGQKSRDWPSRPMRKEVRR